jgi:hypothetical protein
MFADMEPTRITDTNLNVSQDLEVKLGETLTVFCRSEGNPEPKTHWLKVSSTALSVGCWTTTIVWKEFDNRCVDYYVSESYNGIYPDNEKAIK